MLDNWLRPLDAAKLPTDLADDQLGSRLKLFTDRLPDLRDVRLALLGFDARGANAVRRQLYPLSFSFRDLVVADLGNVRKTEVPFLIAPIKELLQSGIFPLIIGGPPRQTLAQYQAFLSLQKNISLLVVDERVRLNADDKKAPGCFLNDILLSRHAHLFHFGLIGLQSHFVPPPVFQYLEDHHFDAVRLGRARADLTELEPLLRDADLLSLHLAALKSADAPGQLTPSPSGFASEEACQIARYAGLSDKLKAFGIYGYRPAADRKQITAQTIAQLIWYFIDGFAARKQDFPVSTDGLTEYIVDFKGHDYQLTFWKSLKSGRWWMQVPVKTRKKVQRHLLVPCSYRDYKLAGQGELPDRLLNAVKRFG